MKFSVRLPLLTALLITMIGTAVFAVILRQRPESPESRFARTISEFEAERAPLSRLKLSDVLNGRNDSDLLGASLALPHVERYPFAEIISLRAYAETCAIDGSKLSPSPGLRKAWVWHRFLCGHSPALPKDFLRLPVKMHPSGVSFARLSQRRQLGFPPGEVDRNLHVSEKIEELIGKVRASDVMAFQRLDAHVFTPEYFFIRHETRHSGPGGDASETTYLGYPAEAAQRSLSASGFEFEPAGSSACAVRSGSYCWSWNGGPHRKIQQLLLVISIIVTLIALYLAFAYLRDRLRDRRRRELVMQMLAHEIRTPVTALKLSVESLRERFDELPDASQRVFLKICDDVGRLGRVVDASRAYLEASHNRGEFAFKRIRLESLNEWIQASLLKFGEKVRFVPTVSDCAAWVDPYWLDVCLSNLVANGLNHGAPPVKVRLTVLPRGRIQFEIEDSGTRTLPSLDDLTRPFSGHRSGGGLGLGLTIVRRVIEADGGEMRLTQFPTRFSFSMRGGQ